MTTTEKMTLEKFAEQALKVIRETKGSGFYFIEFNVNQGNPLPDSFKLAKEQRLK